ncbi:MAG: DUF2330 domain-containing protein [Nannocystaceae bacterium]
MKLSPTLCATAAALALLAPRIADACGGLFCDAGPMTTPVDQTGENILFVMNGAQVEAHIQIQYDPDTDADQFAWVIPLQALPAFSVGSDPLITNLLAGTVPSYQLLNTFDDCGDQGFPTTTDPSTGGFGTDGSPGDSGTGGEPGPEVILQTTVGAFDIVVLQGEDTPGLMQWLGDNGYQQDPDAAPIFDEYLKEGYLFAAFKLTNGAGVDQIHPIVLTFDTGEACVPLRLTRIAAKEDMEVRTFFLGEARVAPRNYRHVIVNPLKIDWLNLQGVAANYKEVITQAVDALKSDGHGFVTEYAGASSVVGQGGLHDPSWQAAPFVGAQPTAVVDTLEAQGIMACFANMCEYYHPLVEGLLREFLPVPDGLAADDFYACLECYPDSIDPNAWDGQAFADAYQQRVIDPGLHAVDLLNTWPYLTRMYTTISPGEMTVDPFFHENPQLPDVSASRAAVRRNLCTGDAVVRIPDGREVYVPQGEGWPAFVDELPYEEDIEETMQSGAPVSLVDNTALINSKLDEWNSAHNWPRDFNEGGTETDAAGGTGGLPEGGCGCRSAGPGGALGLGLLLLTLGVRRRRRAPCA